jgi:eukaryotic-like serine/threonine-protein kinase
MLSKERVVTVGTVLADRYRVERVLGQGGMGVVVAARHLVLDEPVAIKFLRFASDGTAVERFLREARAAAKLRGEHVCRVFDFGRLHGGAPYLVMEHLEGVDLGAKLIDEGPQPVALVTGWLIQVCDALAEAHGEGIIHRDVKPENVFLASRSDGSACAKLLDFGISKRLGKASWHTLPKALLGSPSYMSPEQIGSAADVGPRADIWGLGVTLYELLSGELPFAGASIMETVFSVRTRKPRPLSEVRRGIPEALSRVVARCLAKDPTDRYGTVAELVAELAPFAPPDAQSLVTRLTHRNAQSSEASIVPDLQLRVDSMAPELLAHEPTEVARPTPTAIRVAAAQSSSSTGAEETIAAEADPSRSPSVWPSSMPRAGFFIPNPDPRTRRIRVPAALRAAEPETPAAPARSRSCSSRRSSS